MFLLVLAGIGVILSLVFRVIPSPAPKKEQKFPEIRPQEMLVSGEEITESLSSVESATTASEDRLEVPPSPPKTFSKISPDEDKVFSPPPIPAPLPPPAPKSVPSPAPIPALLPPLNVEALLNAVVKIECRSADGLGKYTGSGFVINGSRVVTAAHVIMDSGSEVCTVIFPRERQPAHYLRGTIIDFKDVRSRHDEKGIDVAVLAIPEIDAYPEARAIFKEYPSIPYPLCTDPVMLKDVLLHFGYPSNYTDQNYLSMLSGEAVLYADITGIRERLSEDSTYTFKTPVFSYTRDESGLHAYMVSRVASFYGDSGGLAFNKTKQCVIGPHRGGTIGGRAGENYSVFMVLGWENLRPLIEP